MDNCNCYGALALGIVVPLAICLVFYLLLIFYSFYYTERNLSTDLKKVRSDRLALVDEVYEDKIEQIDAKIRKIESMPDP